MRNNSTSLRNRSITLRKLSINLWNIIKYLNTTQHKEIEVDTKVEDEDLEEAYV